jgi:pimeloyl-ACP methyl ester carboxylesterase
LISFSSSAESLPVPIATNNPILNPSDDIQYLFEKITEGNSDCPELPPILLVTNPRDARDRVARDQDAGNQIAQSHTLIRNKFNSNSYCLILSWTDNQTQLPARGKTWFRIIPALDHSSTENKTNSPPPLLFFVNGGPGMPSTSIYDQHWLLLREKYTLVFFDQRGTGKSAVSFTDSLKSHLTGIAAIIKDMKAAKDQLTPSQPISIIAHSFGGAIAEAFAAFYPTDIQSMVLLASSYGFDFMQGKIERGAGSFYPFDELWQLILNSVQNKEIQNKLQFYLAESEKLIEEKKTSFTSNNQQEVPSLQLFHRALVSNFMLVSYNPAMVQIILKKISLQDPKALTLVQNFLINSAGENWIVNETTLCSDGLGSIGSTISKEIYERTIEACNEFLIRDTDNFIDFKKLQRSIHAPALIITGDSDEIVSPQLGFDLSHKLQNSRFISIKDGKHNFFRTQVDTYYDEVLSFLGLPKKWSSHILLMESVPKLPVADPSHEQ